MPDHRAGLTPCGGCARWRRMAGSIGTCRLHAPATGTTSAEVAHWPETDAAQGCGDAAPTAGAAPMVLCHDCLFWQEPSVGHGIVPVDRRDHPGAWWQLAGFCIRHAPTPAPDPGNRAFWRATHASDCCAEGRAAAPDGGV
jgi:hypothetical protein